jgi:hypothetical protein
MCTPSTNFSMNGGRICTVVGFELKIPNLDPSKRSNLAASAINQISVNNSALNSNSEDSSDFLAKP